jgi:dienelactone hydrolase
MNAKSIALLSLLAGFLAGNAHAEVTNKAELPARVELHAVPTVWITDQQFLTGDDKGKPITLGVELRIAQAKGKTPLVVLMHGSSGIGANVPFWARELNALGISTLTIDGMTGRGVQGVGENQALIGRLNFIVDIYRSLEVVAKHPRIDSSRVALMGFSRGGQAALYASVQRFQKQWNKSGVDFIAYIPFYPDCATTYDGDTDTGSAPIRIFHGAPDNYNPVASCKKFITRLKDAKRDVELTEYPNAQHGFDNPIAPTTPVAATNSQSVRDCTIKETAPGTLTNTETSAPFTFKDACVKLSPLVGADPEATDAARTAVKAFLKATFKLD